MASKAVEEFLKRLAKTPRNWTVCDGGMIRMIGAQHCPISSVTLNEEDFGLPEDAAKTKLNMTSHEAELVVSAADTAERFENDGLDITIDEHMEMRRRLLEACGLGAVNG